MNIKKLLAYSTLIVSTAALSYYVITKEPSPPEPERVYHFKTMCDKESKLKVADYILKCLDAASQSGEAEPEDFIWDCNNIAKETYCKVVHTVLINQEHRVATQEQIDAYYKD